MINMGLQPEYGTRVSREIYAEGDMNYYRFAKRGSNAKGVAQATARAAVIGLVIPSQEGFRPDGSGGIVPRTKYVLDEIPDVLETGVGYVMLGSGVTSAVPGNEVMSDGDGKAVVYTAPTISASAKGGAPTDVELQAIAALAVGENKVKAGKLIDGGNAGDIVRMKLYGDD
jgi:hypothetical protein